MARRKRPSYDPGPVYYDDVRPHRPIYLSGVASPELDEMQMEGFDVGLLATPDTYHAATTLTYRTWALDNGAFGAWKRGEPFDLPRWLQWLASWPAPAGVRFGNQGTSRESRLMIQESRSMGTLGCLFAVAPDVVGDFKATWETSSPWFETVRRLGFPVALAAQNGMEDDPRPWDESDRWDCLFIGGDDAFKDGQDALELAAEARRHGKWVHVGRVNTKGRIMHWAGLADSMDGTLLRHASARRPDGTPEGIYRLRRWLGELAQPQLVPPPRQVWSWRDAVYGDGTPGSGGDVTDGPREIFA